MEFEQISDDAIAQILVSVGVIVVSAILRWIFLRISNQHLIRNKLDKSRRLYLLKVINRFISLFINRRADLQSQGHDCASMLINIDIAAAVTQKRQRGIKNQAGST